MRNSIRSFVVASAFCVSSVAQGQTVINFDNLANGTVVTNQYAGVVFSSTLGFVNYITAQSEYNGSKPNFICSGPVGGSINCTAPTIITFAAAVSGLSILGMGINNVGKVAEAQLYNGVTFLGTQNIIGNSESLNPVLVNLSAWGSVTRLELTNITDGGGIGWDNLTYSANTVPEPSTVVLTLAGLAGIVIARRKRTQ